MRDRLESLLMRWKRLGVEWDCSMSPTEPDPESVLVETAALLPDIARLLPTTVTWIARFHTLLSPSRLQQMAASVTDAEHSACLGMLLSMAQTMGHAASLGPALGACKRVSSPIAMLRAERSEAYRLIVEREAHPISRYWGILAPLPELKDDALRPLPWILQHNPQLRLRALLNSDLRASILSSLSEQPAAGQSESALARALGVTRKAVREALDKLEFCGLVVRERDGRNMRIRACKVEIIVGRPQGAFAVPPRSLPAASNTTSYV